MSNLRSLRIFLILCVTAAPRPPTAMVAAAPKAPHSLYVGDDPGAADVINIGSDDYDGKVFRSTHAWMMQFYNSWCGHCIDFAPHYKQLAVDLRGRIGEWVIWNVVKLDLTPMQNLHWILR